jgi:hypothetical protein
MKSSVKIDHHLFEVEFFNFGREKYYVDGQLIDNRWNLSFVGTRELKVGNRDVKINVNSVLGEYYCQLFVDNTLHTEQLFPEINEKVRAMAEKRKPFESRIKAAKIFVAALVACAISVTLYNNLWLAP